MAAVRQPGSTISEELLKYINSPYNFNTLSSRQVMRVKITIN